MIRQCDSHDLESICVIINEAAQAYKAAIPKDCWKEPYMSKDDILREIEDGVVFWGYEEEGGMVAVMGIQDIHDVTLVRHAYVRPSRQKQGLGGELLSYLQLQTTRPILIGTWADARWAINFYENNGFRTVPPEIKDMLLRRYWTIPERQIESSIVLANDKWFRERSVGLFCM